MMLNAYLKKLLAGKDLSAAETGDMLELMTDPDVSRVRAGAALTAMHLKGESRSELVGGARMLRKHAVFIDCGGRETVDIVGTGGDGAGTFNISTAAAFVASGAGCVVAKHGNRAASGKCGSADVLEELGVNLDAPPEVMEECIRKHGLGFLFARTMHPVMGAVAGLRRELGFRTIFNLLGPLSNPAGAKHLVVGVYDVALTGLFAQAFLDLGAKHVMVVHGGDGTDEISVSAPTRVAELSDGTISEYDLYPEMLLEHPCAPGGVAGGDAACNAGILRGILECSIHGAPRDAVVLNAGAAIYVAGLAHTLKKGVEMAENSIDSGAALEKLRLLVLESRGGKEAGR